jgi:hypothetical protein
MVRSGRVRSGRDEEMSDARVSATVLIASSLRAQSVILRAGETRDVGDRVTDKCWQASRHGKIKAALPQARLQGW